MPSVLQEWVQDLPLMQQSVLLGAIRGPDGIHKYHDVKYLVRWLRRCILISALDGVVLTDPLDKRGGSFTGASTLNPERYIGTDGMAWESCMNQVVSNYLRHVDEMPHHFHTHLMHAAEIIGYKHIDDRIQHWWYQFYLILVNDLHLQPESQIELDKRLGDKLEDWKARSHPAVTA